MLTDPLWGSTGDLSVPSTQQMAQGFTCGSADPALFNWLFQQVHGEIDDVISTLGGLTPDAGDLTQVRQAIEAYVRGKQALQVAALDYPTIATSDYRLPVTASAGVAGGTVSLTGGDFVTLAEAVGVTHGVMRSWSVPSFTSADLSAASTYYLRAIVVEGSLVVYLQKGTDNDAVPVTLTGTPGATEGGGFDSTRLDMLIAKVETGAAGTVPTVTTLANASRLAAVAYVQPYAFGAASEGPASRWYWALDLRWARAPAGAAVWLAAANISEGSTYEAAYGSDFSHDTDFSAIQSLSVARYKLEGSIRLDATDPGAPSGQIVGVNVSV
jgi:hypothetical protein